MMMARDKESSSSNEAEIMRLVRETNDPVQRATLLVMLGMSTNLMRNTELTMQLHDDFAEHQKNTSAYMKNGEQLLNRGIGAWKVVAWASGGMGTVLLAVVGFYTAEIRDHGLRLQTVETREADTRDLLKDHLRQANPIMRD